MKWLRSVLVALLLSLLLGLVIGTLLRLRLERPRQYIGALLPAAALPLHVGDADAAVLDARHHEEQIG